MSKTLKFSEMRKLYSALPPKKMLWNGVKEGSFGLVFGPSKSGKTIFCENLAVSMAVGRASFFGYQLEAKPKSVLFIGLEESWENRMERNLLQANGLSANELDLLGENYEYQSLDFKSFVHSEQDWENLGSMIESSDAEIVFIDSITRLLDGKMEDSSTAERIMLKLRTISQKSGKTLFAIHHTPKLYNSAITINSIKGSSVFAQESD